MLRVTRREEVTRTAEGEVVRWPRDDRKVCLLMLFFGCGGRHRSSSFCHTHPHRLPTKTHPQKTAPPSDERAQGAAGARREARRRDGAAPGPTGLHHQAARERTEGEGDRPPPAPPRGDGGGAAPLAVGLRGIRIDMYDKRNRSPSTMTDAPLSQTQTNKTNRYWKKETGPGAVPALRPENQALADARPQKVSGILGGVVCLGWGNGRYVGLHADVSMFDPFFLCNR